jgi:hypothetical protein
LIFVASLRLWIDVKLKDEERKLLHLDLINPSVRTVFKWLFCCALRQPLGILVRKLKSAKSIKFCKVAFTRGEPMSNR